MKKIQLVLTVCASLMLLLGWLITSFEIGAYSDFGFYEKEYKKYNVMPDLTMEIDDVMDVTHEMMDYLRGDRENLVVYTTIDGVENQEFFNEQDKIHFADVKNLFLGGLALRRGGLIGLILIIALLIFTKADLKRIVPRGFLIGLGIALAATVFLGVAFAIDFTAAFTTFHEIFFTNDLWLFDPATDYMIRMLPEAFFSDMVIRIGCIFIAGLAVMLAGCAIMIQKGKGVSKE